MTEEERKAFVKERVGFMKTLFYWWMGLMIPFLIYEYIIGYFD